MPRDHFAKLAFAVAGLLGLLMLAACGPAATPTATPQPAASAVLQKILNECWGVNQIQDLDGNRADQVSAFERCARKPLLNMAQAYPDAAEPHRVLAWGYLYSLKDAAVAQAEYERAAEIYARQGDKADQAEMLVRIAVQLTMQYDPKRGCALLQQAAAIDPANARIPTLLQNFFCIPRAPLPATATAATTQTPAAAPEPTATEP
jgi:tetratricopeptide (TPR) repeat protein